MKCISRYFKFTVLFLISLILIAGSECKNDSDIKRNSKSRKVKSKKIAKIVSPGTNETFTCGEPLNIKLAIENPDAVDSIKIISRGVPDEIITQNFESIQLETASYRTGKNYIKILLYNRDNSTETHTLAVLFKSNIVPENIGYSIVNTYPHDEKAFTQGLIFEDGYLYESTGQPKESSIRKVEIVSGKPIINNPLPDIYFGEGCAIFKNRLYQITYKAQVGFIYDKMNLEQIRKFDYPVPEGWGLTSDETNLYMSDGSNKIFIVEPEYFTQIDQIEVYDNQGPVDKINELEYINGRIFANLFGKSVIVIIDVKTGKIIGKFDLKALIPEEIGKSMSKVLNGIAYNNENNHLYVTGKYWPVLYEIRLHDYFAQSD